MPSINPTQALSDAYGAYQTFQNVQSGPLSGAGTAAGAASTAMNIAAIFGSNASEKQKIQAAVEQAGLFVADLYTYGLSSTVVGMLDKYLPGVTNTLRKFIAKEPVLNAIAGLFTTDRWKTEGNRLQKVIDSGVQIPEELQGAMQLTRGRQKEELIDYSVPADFRGVTADGRWVNNAFAISRTENDLQPQDIWGYATFFEKFGNDWLQTFSEEDRYMIAARALELGAVREHHGTIDVNWTPEFDAAVAEIRTRNSSTVQGPTGKSS